MNTLIYTSCIGLFCLLAEILNLRKILVPFILAGLAAVFYINMSGWGAPAANTIGGIDISHMIRTDNFSIAFNGLCIFIASLIFIMSADYYKNEPKHLSDYLAIIVFILCGAIVLSGYWNMVMLFLGIEIVSISLYIMAGSRRFDVRSNEAGFKYFLMGSFASGILLFGIALVYGASGSFELDKIAEYASSGNTGPLFQTGVLMVLMALLFKVAAVPFHFWSPDVYEGAPALVTALMSTLVKIAVFAAFYRLVSIGFAGVHEYASLTLTLVAGATLVLGNLVALSQTSFKRLLAYSGISHAGYMLLGILSISSAGSSSALFFYGLAYSLATIGAFAVAIPVFSGAGNENISAFNGLGKKKPLLAGFLTLFMLSLAGIPPLAGFLGKYSIFSEAVNSGYTALTLLAIIGSIVGIYYYFKVILAMYGKSPEEHETNIPGAYWVVIVLCAALTLLLGVYPAGLINLL